MNPPHEKFLRTPLVGASLTSLQRRQISR